MLNDLLFSKTWQDWLFDHAWQVEIVFTLVFFTLIFISWSYLVRVGKKRVKNTLNEWDDLILKTLNAPIMAFIVVFGIQQVGSGLLNAFPDYPDTSEFFSIIRIAIIVLTIFWLLLRFVSGMELLYRRKKIKVGDKQVDAGTIHSTFRVIRAIIFIAALLTALNSFGISISGVLTFGGVGSVILGFAAKDTLSNFFSGVLIFWERPFVIGDWIRHPGADIEGVVEHIGWRMTQIRTFDQRPLYVPNSLFFNSVIENPQRMTNRRIYEYMGLRYDDVDKLPAVLADVRRFLREHADIDQTKIQMVAFDKYGASSLDFFVYVMTKTTNWKEFHSVKEDVLLNISFIVNRHGCEFAFPTRTLHHIPPNAAPPPSGN